MQGGAFFQAHLEKKVRLCSTIRDSYLLLLTNVIRRNAEMEREIADLRQRLSSDGSHVHTVEPRASDKVSQCSEDMYYGPDPANISRGRTMSAKLEPQTLATPLTMHSDGSILSQDDSIWRLEDVSLSRQRVARLFDQ